MSTDFTDRMDPGDRNDEHTSEPRAHHLEPVVGSPHAPSGQSRARLVRVERGAAGHAHVAPIPNPLTSFIGRESLLADLVETLRRTDIRLLTVVGPGGVGKTRLAIQAARSVQGDYHEGVVWVSLASVPEPDLVLPALALALGLPERDDRSLLQRVTSSLGTGELLIVLDNFEQIVDAGPMLTDILHACPRVRMLVTSRTVLRVSGEHVFQLPPMSLARPDADLHNSVRQTPADPLGGSSEAVRLLVERVRASRGGVDSGEATDELLEEICARLDGLPLAIELAASKSRMLSLPALLTHLGSRLPLLGEGPRDAPDRLRTMRNAIAWSYDLLPAELQRVFRRLAVFAEGATLEAIGLVCCWEPNGGVAEHAFSAISELMDQSLIVAVTDSDQPRFAMLETVREFGFEQLQVTGELGRARSLHARTFLDLGLEIDRELGGPKVSMWLARLDAERANMRSALSWLVAQQQAEDALRLACALWRYWRIRGYLTEGMDAIGSALQIADEVPKEIRAEALGKLGNLENFAGELDTAVDHLEQSLEMFIAVGDRAGEATVRDSLGTWWLLMQDRQRAVSHYERALEIANELDLEQQVSETLGNLGLVALQRRELSTAKQLLDDALEVARRRDDQRAIANHLQVLGRVEFGEQRYDAAREDTQRALAILREIGDHLAIVPALTVLGQVASAKGEYSRAVALMLESLRLRLELGMNRNFGEFMERLAHAAVHLDPQLATRLLGAAASDCDATGRVRLPFDENAWNVTVEMARTALDEERYAAEWSRGQGMTLTEAANEAVRDLEGLARLPDEDTLDAETTPAGADTELSPRELEVLRAIAEGCSNREIADNMYLSPSTVKRHVSNILRKMQVRSRSAAIARANEIGLIERWH